MSSKSGIINLKTINSDELFDLIEEVTDEQAIDSEYGGDSDAEDTIPAAAPIREANVRTAEDLNEPGPSVTRPKRKAKDKSRTQTSELFSQEESGPYDSNDSLRDPDYYDDEIPIENTNMQFIDINEVSDEENFEIEEPEIANRTYNFKRIPCVPNAFKSIQFAQKFGSSFDADWESPISIFQNCFDDTLTELLVFQSNKYAAQFGVDLNLTATKLKAFIGILIIMGFHQLSAIRLYWSSNENFRVVEESPLVDEVAILFYRCYSNK